jgi:predicted thioesterase
VTIPVGLAHEAEFRPERWHVAAAIGNDGVMAVSTPAILGFLEQASLEAIAPYQGQHEVSVGAHVTLDHVAPAFSGAGDPRPREGGERLGPSDQLRCHS